MTLYTVTLSASGDATVTVDAIDVETAEYLALALARHPGMIDSATCEWVVESVTEAPERETVSVANP